MLTLGSVQIINHILYRSACAMSANQIAYTHTDSPLVERGKFGLSTKLVQSYSNTNAVGIQCLPHLSTQSNYSKCIHMVFALKSYGTIAQCVHTSHHPCDV